MVRRAENLDELVTRWAIRAPAPAPAPVAAPAPAPAPAPAVWVESEAEKQARWAAALAAGILPADYVPPPAYPTWVDTSAFLSPGWENVGNDTRPGWMRPESLATIIAPELAAAGFSGEATTWVGGLDGGYTVAPELSDWMAATGNTLQADAQTKADTITVRVLDEAGATIAQAEASTADAWFGAVVNLGVAAVAAVGAGSLLGGAAETVGAGAGADRKSVV